MPSNCILNVLGTSISKKNKENHTLQLLSPNKNKLDKL